MDATKSKPLPVYVDRATHAKIRFLAELAGKSVAELTEELLKPVVDARFKEANEH